MLKHISKVIKETWASQEIEKAIKDMNARYAKRAIVQAELAKIKFNNN